jgi:hypothetical protein
LLWRSDEALAAVGFAGVTGPDVDRPKKLEYNDGMSRPEKDTHSSLDTDLRIPLTHDQKKVIVEAAHGEPAGPAAWARAVLLRAASELSAGRAEEKGRSADSPQPDAPGGGDGNDSPPPADLERQFRELAARWKKETRHLSVIRRITAHPAYREIVAMGKAAVPLLLAELRRQPDHWFTALQEITGVDPAPSTSSGDVAAMARAWIAWGEAEGFRA